LMARSLLHQTLTISRTNGRLNLAKMTVTIIGKTDRRIRQTSVCIDPI
jgi:hypothetical protein